MPSARFRASASAGEVKPPPPPVSRMRTAMTFRPARRVPAGIGVGLGGVLDGGSPDEHAVDPGFVVVVDDAQIESRRPGGLRFGEGDLLAEPRGSVEAAESETVETVRDGHAFPSGRIEVDRLPVRPGFGAGVVGGVPVRHPFGVGATASDQGGIARREGGIKILQPSGGFAAHPRLGVRPAPVVGDEADGDARLAAQGFAEKVADGGEAAPAAFGDAGRGADLPVADQGGLGREGGRLADREKAQLRIVRPGDRFGAALDGGQAHLHVGLSGAEPDVAHENVL